MNQMDIQKFRNDVLRNCVKHLSWKRNVVYLNSGNSWKHEYVKCKVCFDLQQSGKQYVTEAPMGSRGRPDILVLDDAQIIEILVSETEEDVAYKVSKYPPSIEVIAIKNWTDIQDGTYKVIKERLL